MKRFLFLMTLLMTMLYGRAATEVTFDFTANEWNHPLGTSLDGDPGNLDELTKDDVLVVFKQAKHKDYPPRYWSGPQVRAYTNNIIRVVAPTGKAITKIEFTAAGTSYFGLTAAGGTLEGTTWTGNAIYAKFIPTKTNRLTKMVVTLDDTNEETDKAGDADETVFLDFNDPTIHDEFDVSSTTYLTEDIVLSDGHRDSDDKIDGENRLTTTIPFIPDVANSKQNYIRYSSGKVSMYLRGGKVVFKTHADKIFKNIKMTASAFNATLNGEEVTKEQITGDGWEGNSNVVEMEVTGGTNITDITFVIADKPMEEVVEPELTEFYIMGSGTENEWDNTTAMTLNEETDAFEYELTLTSTGYITFGDAAFTDWDDFSANHRYGIGEGDVNATLDTPTKLEKYSDGCLVITEAGKYKVTVTKDLEVTITKTGDVTAEISRVQICGATDPEWSNRIDFDLTKGEGEEEVYTGVLDLTESTNDVEFKLVVNEGTWIGFNQLTLDAPEGWVEGPNGDGNNFVLKNASTGYRTYTVTATWEVNADASANWTLKIEGKDMAETELEVPGTEIWSSEEAADVDWNQGKAVMIDAENFADVKVGDRLNIGILGAPEDAAPNNWAYQVALQDGDNWKNLEGGEPLKQAGDYVHSFIITGDMLRYMKRDGLALNGTKFQVKKVAVESAYEGSDESIWLGEMKGNVQINICHFANAADFSGVKKGDIIRVTLDSPNWVGINYNTTAWKWSDFAEGDFEVINNWTDPVVDFKIKTDEAVNILNKENGGIFINCPNTLATQVEIIPAVLYAVNIGESENGTVTADMAEAIEGETVTLTVTPAEGYELESLTVKDADGNDVEVTDNTFTMPASDVTVTATFSEIPEDDPTVMVAPESGDFAAIVAQAVKEGKETLALPAGAAYKAGSTV